MFKKIVTVLALTGLVMGLVWSASAAPPTQQVNPSGTNPIRLQFATFDPLETQPVVPQSLQITDYAAYDGSGPYIVQFQGPILDDWKEALSQAGAQVGEYIPDYAFVVRMDDQTRSKIEALSFVRWVGIYQPAYKISPQLKTNSLDLYRVHLAGWADQPAVREQLDQLGIAASGPGNSLVARMSSAQVSQLAQLPDVLWIEDYRMFETYNDQAAGIMNSNTAWTAGYDGTGQIVTIADTGLDTGVDTAAVGDIHLDFDNRVSHISSWPVLSSPGCIDNPGADDGASDVDSGHGTHVAGSVGGDGTRSGGVYKGSAPGATLTFQAVEQLTKWTGLCALVYGSQSYELTGIPANLNTLFQESYGWGARIHSNSWGSSVDGEYDEASQQADQFTWNNKTFTILFSAGNDGVDANSDGYVDEDSMGSPATAKNVITVGASENLRSTGGYNPDTYGTLWPPDYPANPTSSDRVSNNAGHLAAFSSRGPTDDGRIKPDVVAPGTNILSTRSSLASGTGWGVLPAADPDRPYYLYMGGTSMATPLTAGGAVVVRDYLVDGEGHANPSSALVKAIMINSAVDISGYGNSAREAGQPIPNNHEGWGRVDLAKATNGTNRDFVDNPSLKLSTNKAYSMTFNLTNPAFPLKVSLVWTDYPGNPAAAKQLVNNLDLRVVAPNGSTAYYGNNFSNGWSSSGGYTDQINNVENVYVQSPTAGKWTIQVIGTNVPQSTQPFALVVTGQGTLGSPSLGPAPQTPQLPAIYLPILEKGGSSLANGDFEAGATYWTEYSTHGYALILQSGSFPGSVTPHSGSWAVWLGGDNDEISYIEQQVIVPAGSPYLAYWHWIASEDSCGYDFAGVLVDGSVVDQYDLCDAQDTNGWAKHVVNLGVYAGQTVALQIRAETDYLLNSNLFVDDVFFQVSASSTETSPPHVNPENATSRSGELVLDKPAKQEVQPISDPKANRAFHP